MISAATDVVQVTCKVCGREFSYSPTDYARKGLQHTPRVCPACADKRAGLEKIVVERRLLRHWEGVEMQKNPFKVEKEAGDYILHTYGGRFFGIWGGAWFSEKFLIYIAKSLLQTPFPWLVDIREMEKKFRRGSGIEGLSKYYVIEPSAEKAPRWLLYELRAWRKTTLKGYGRDRDYKEILVPDNEGEERIVGEILSVKTEAKRTGRFGNHYRIVLANRPCKVEGTGTP